MASFTEKLTRLTEGKNKAEIARRAGLKATTISDYVAKGYTPRADIALKMAKALNVDAAWLIDDERNEWPPPTASAPTVANLSDDELMAEVARRYRSKALEAAAELDAAEKIDVADLANRVLAIPVGEPLPPNLQREVESLESCRWLLDRTIDRYLPSRWAERHDRDLPDDAKHPPNTDADVLQKRWIKIKDKLGPADDALTTYLQLRSLGEGAELLRPMLETARKQVTAAENADPLSRLSRACETVFDALDSIAHTSETKKKKAAKRGGS